MVRLPQIQRQVGPGGFPAVRAQGAPPAAFGAGLGATISGIAAQEVEAQARSEAHDVTRQLEREAREFWYGQGGGEWQSGKDFFEWAGKAPEPFIAGMRERLEPLSGRARAIADDGIARIESQLRARIDLKAEPARAKMHTDERDLNLAGYIEGARRDAANPATGLVSLTSAIQDGEDELKHFVENHPDLVPGDNAAWLEGALNSYRSGLVRDVVSDALLGENPYIAREYQEKFGHMLVADDRVTVSKSMKTSDNMETIVDHTEFLMASAPIMVGDDAPDVAEAAGKFYRPPAEQIAAYDQEIREIGKAQGWDAETTEKAAGYVRKRANDALQLLRAQQDSALESLSNDLTANGGDLVALQGSRPSDMAFIEARGRGVLAEHAAGINKARSEADERENYRTLRKMALEERETFRALPRVAIDAMLTNSPSLRNEVLQWQQAPAGAMGHSSVISEHVDRMGYGGDTLDAFEQRVEAVIEAAGGKDKVPITELRTILNNLSGEFDVQGFFDERGFKVTLDQIEYDHVPDDYAEDARAALQRNAPEGTTERQIQDMIRLRFFEDVIAGRVEPTG